LFISSLVLLKLNPRVRRNSSDLMRLEGKLLSKVVTAGKRSVRTR